MHNQQLEGPFPDYFGFDPVTWTLSAQGQKQSPIRYSCCGTLLDEAPTKSITKPDRCLPERSFGGVKGFAADSWGFDPQKNSDQDGPRVRPNKATQNAPVKNDGSVQQ